MTSVIQSGLTFTDKPQGNPFALSQQAMHSTLAATRRMVVKVEQSGIELLGGCTALPKRVQMDLARFLDEIPKIKFLQPDGTPKKEWKVFRASTWKKAHDRESKAEQKAAAKVAGSRAWWQSAVDVKYKAARVAAKEAARDAGRWDASRVAQGMAWQAAEDATKLVGDAWMGRSAVMGCISMMAALIVVSDLNFEGKEAHFAYSNACMEVLQKGYALGAEVDDILYVYAKR